MTEKLTLSQILDEVALQNDLHAILLTGPHGTGKTSWGQKLGELKGLPVYQFTFNKNTSLADLLGFWQVKNGTFEYFGGPIYRAFKEVDGAVLVLNEIDDAINGECEPILMSILDDPEVRRVYAGSGEVLTSQKVFVVATMNSRPDALRPALRDRFEVEIEVMAPSEEMYNSLPSDLGKFCRNWYAKSTREDAMYEDAVDTKPFYSFRRFKAYGKLRKSLQPTIAAQLVFSLKPSEVDAFLQSIEVASLKS